MPGSEQAALPSFPPESHFILELLWNSPKTHPATLHYLIFSRVVFQQLGHEELEFQALKSVPCPQPGGGAAVINSSLLNYFPSC